MPERQSEKSRFQSRFMGGFLSDGQYLAENMIDRQARKNKTELPAKFWSLPRWKRDYLIQVRHAASLLKLYSVDAILKALRTPQGKKIYSLGAPWLDPLVATEQLVIDRQASLRENTILEPPQPVKAAEPPRPAFAPQKTTMDRLRDLN